MEESVVGTNGVGTVLEDGLPVRIAGGEHFADACQDYTCVGVPIRHPITRKLRGVLNLTARYDDVNHRMLPYAMMAAQEIEQQLYLHGTAPTSVDSIE